MSEIRISPKHAVPVVGMAALWTSVFKQLLYPVLFAYYRTGDEGAVFAQGVYSATLVAVAFGLIVAHGRLGGLVGKRRWVVAAVGLGGALGIALRAFSDLAPESSEIAMCFGAALSAAYLPVHFAFWALYARRLDAADATRTFAASFALFLVVYGALTVVGANSAYISVACPAISAAMALACPHPNDDGVVEAAPAPASVPSGDCPPATHRPGTAPATPELPAGFAEAFDLSDREAELAAYAHRNWSARRIAGELFIAESTVYTHLKRIYRKTDVHSKHELIELIDSWRRSG